MGAVATFLPIVIQLLELAPTLINGGRQVVADAQSIWNSATADTPPTPDEQAQYSAALDAAHAQFQADAARQDDPA